MLPFSLLGLREAATAAQRQVTSHQRVIEIFGRASPQTHSRMARKIHSVAIWPPQLLPGSLKMAARESPSIHFARACLFRIGDKGPTILNIHLGCSLSGLGHLNSKGMGSDHTRIIKYWVISGEKRVTITSEGPSAMCEQELHRQRSLILPMANV